MIEGLAKDKAGVAEGLKKNNDLKRAITEPLGKVGKP